MWKEKWNGQPINTQKKSDILRPRKYLYADDSTFAAVFAARTGNILLNPLMTKTLMWKAWIAHSACCDSESRSCNPESLQNAFTRASELIKGHQKYKGPAGHMVSKCLLKTMERNTGDKGLALEALLLFYSMCIHIRLIHLYSDRWLLLHSLGREEVLHASIMAWNLLILEFSELRTYNLSYPFMSICVEAWDSHFFTKFRNCLLSAAYHLFFFLHCRCCGGCGESNVK